MAKRSEDGIEYFPINSDIIQNPKIKLVVAEFGPKVWTVLLPLYCKIYREKGYWIDWLDEDSKMLFAQDECKTEVTVVNEFVSGFLRRSLFNKRVFETFGILTSDRIQENFLEAKKRNKFVDFIEEFSVISPNVYKKFKNVNIIELNVNMLSKKVSILPQKKKENKIIEGELDKQELSAKIFPSMPKETDVGDLPKTKIVSTIELLKFTAQTDISQSEVVGMWKVFKNQNLTGKKYYADEEAVHSHFMNWIKKIDFKKNKLESNENAAIARKIEQEQSRRILGD